MTVIGGYGNRRWHWIVIRIILLQLAVMLAIAVNYQSGYTMMYYPGFFIFPFEFFIFPFFWVFVLFLFWHWSRRRRWDPKEIAKVRYARGEITKDQFEQVMKNLEQHTSQS